MKKYKIIWISIVVVLAMAVVIAVSGGVDSSNNSDTIKIGFIGALSGADPSYGEAMKGGVEIAVEEINSQGGIGGKKVEVIYEDGKCIDSKSAISAFQKLNDIDRVKAIIGGGCSNEVASITKMVDSNEVFLISSGASSPDISGSSKYIFRNSINDTESSKQLAIQIIKDGYNDIAIITDNSDYASGFRKSFINEFDKVGGVVSVDTIVQANQSDYRSDIAKLKAVNPKVIFINPAVPKTAGIIIKQIKEAGLNSKIYLTFMATPAFFNIAGDSADGATVIDLPKVTGDLSRNILTKFETIYGHKTVYEYNTVAAYDAVMVIKEAIVKVGYDSNKISNYLSKHNFSGGLGNFSFNDQGDVSGMKYTLQIIKGHELVEIK
jgi:branched-chain amino acid transport system substrate-binding protein